ncbi:hypothetical protein V6N13_083726 [Hibiscus sabdariffa]
MWAFVAKFLNPAFIEEDTLPTSGSPTEDSEVPGEDLEVPNPCTSTRLLDPSCLESFGAKLQRMKVSPGQMLMDMYDAEAPP